MNAIFAFSTSESMSSVKSAGSIVGYYHDLLSKYALISASLNLRPCLAYISFLASISVWSSSPLTSLSERYLVLLSGMI